MNEELEDKLSLNPPSGTTLKNNINNRDDKLPFSGGGGGGQKLAAVRLQRYLSYILSHLSNFFRSELPPISF